jgi:hypothetical protein
VILSAIGFPTSMFTALFALARTVGWVAQWNEMIADPEQKIGRPRQLYTGPDAARLRFARPALSGRRNAQELGEVSNAGLPFLLSACCRD